MVFLIFCIQSCLLTHSSRVTYGGAWGIILSIGYYIVVDIFPAVHVVYGTAVCMLWLATAVSLFQCSNTAPLALSRQVLE